MLINFITPYNKQLCDYCCKNQLQIINYKDYKNLMRRKQKSYYYSRTPKQLQNQEIDEHKKMPYRFSEPIFADSLERFQRQIQNSLIVQKQINKNNREKNRMKRRTKTQVYDSEPESQGVPIKEFNKLQNHISELKNELSSYKKSNQLQDKLDRLVQQMARNRELDRELMKQKQNIPILPSNIYYPPPMPQMPYMQPPYRDRDRPRKDSYDNTNYSLKSSVRPFKPKNRLKRLLRKYLFVVAFPFFLKSEAKKISLKRKQYLRTFYLQKFNSQMMNLKNWLVDCHGYSFPVILQKQKLNLEFWSQKRENIRMQKINLLVKLVQIGLEKMRQDCMPQKTSFFMQILQNLCGRGSFCMSRFWSVAELKHICISEYYGCIRADQTLQKFLLGLVVFVKVLIFNMLLQPHKFDNLNFPKNKQPLNNNMHIIASIYYKVCKIVLKEFIEQMRPNYYKLGNWLSVKQQFIVQCCQPLLFKEQYPNEDEWITGMLDKETQDLQTHSQWGGLIVKFRQILDSLHREMMKRRKEVIRNQKYKLYN